MSQTVPSPPTITAVHENGPDEIAYSTSDGTSIHAIRMARTQPGQRDAAKAALAAQGLSDDTIKDRLYRGCALVFANGAFASISGEFWGDHSSRIAVAQARLRRAAEVTA